MNKIFFFDYWERSLGVKNNASIWRNTSKDGHDDS